MVSLKALWVSLSVIGHVLTRMHTCVSYFYFVRI